MRWYSDYAYYCSQRLITCLHAKTTRRGFAIRKVQDRLERVSEVTKVTEVRALCGLRKGNNKYYKGSFGGSVDEVLCY